MQNSSLTPYHVPVMLPECLEGLNINPEGLYVDATFGGGGHSKAILEKLTTGKLVAFDQDADAAAQAKLLADDRLIFIESNFRNLQKYLKLYKLGPVNGILADLGISSHQIDEGARGFSTRFNGPLDMRMNQSSGQTAAEFIETASAEQLHRVLGMYGEVHNAKTLAAALVASRVKAPIAEISDLINVLKPLAPRGKEFKYFAQVFQALRIEINEEMAVLESFLLQIPDVLAQGGRLVVMSYHSLEDRLVKNFMAKGVLHGEAEKDFYGNVLKPLNALTRKPMEASEMELVANPRARSAKLRIAEKM